VSFSEKSRRAIEIIHHARRRDRMLADLVLPGAGDSAKGMPTAWDVFDLACTSPVGFRLLEHRLNAGDLSLSFGRKRERLTVRQIAVAELALARMGLAKWLAEQQAMSQQQYVPDGKLKEVNWSACGGATDGVCRRLRRRRRFVWKWWVPEELVTCALHDSMRDKLIILQGTSETLLRDALLTVGAGD
jgi:hypothetical protein